MEKPPKEQTTPKTEQQLKNMELSQSKRGIRHLTVMDDVERKNLWDEWKKIHPKSKKIWRMSNKHQAHTLRCQAPVVIKRLSAIVKKSPANLEDSVNSDFNNQSPETCSNYSEETDMDSISLRSENSDFDGLASSGDTESIESGSGDIDGLRVLRKRNGDGAQNLARANSVSSDTQDSDNHGSIKQEAPETYHPRLITANQEEVSRLFIDEKNMAQWSREHMIV